MVLWSGGGEDGVVLKEEEEGKERKTHTTNEKNKCTIKNKTFNSLFKFVS